MNKTRKILNQSQHPSPDCDVHCLSRLRDWYVQNELEHLQITAPRRRSLSPTRRLALDHLEVNDKTASEQYDAVKLLAPSGHNGREVVVYGCTSVLDIGRLARRTDRRRDEVALHLVSQDPSSAVFRAALVTPVAPAYQMTPRLPHFTEWPNREPSAVKCRNLDNNIFIRL